MAQVKKALVYLYLSIVVHFYLLYLLGITVDKSIMDMLAHPEKYRNPNPVIENIIVDTRTQSEVKPESGKISDKQNKDSGKLADKSDYNLLNPDMRDQKGKKTPESQKNPEEEKIKEDEQENPDGVPVKPTAEETVKPSESGDPTTSYFDPSKPLSVEMTSEGQVSLATVPEEFAAYFIEMQQKIGVNWRKFFPVFQYYQGLIKSGEVVVNYQIDKEGNIINPTIVSSYGYSVIDQSTLNALYYTGNIGPLPEKLAKDSPISINFKFIYVSQ